MVDTAFHDARDDLVEVADYCPLSGLAITGLLASFISLTAFLHWGLCLVAGLAVVLSLAGLRHVASTDPPRLGRKMALIGLALSLFCFVGATAYHMGCSWLTQAQAKQVAELWLNSMLSDDIQNDSASAAPAEALCVSHQLTLPAEERDDRIDRLPQVYAANPAMLADLEEFKNAPHSRELTAYAGRADWVFDHVADQVSDRREEAVVFVYRIQPRENGEAKSFTLRILVSRPKIFAGSVAGWKVSTLN